MAGFLLIHGAAHGAWAWRDVIPALTARGFAARALDLPSHGQDRTPRAEVTLDTYAEAILAALEEDANRGAAPPLLVGHSIAGFPLTLAAERAPDRVAALVYLAALVPEPGLSLRDIRARGAMTPALRAAIRRAEDGRAQLYDPEAAGEVFYHDCPADAVAFARDRLCPQPVAPFDEAVTTGDRAASVRRVYIRCSEDRAIAPDYQRRVAGTLGPGRAFDLDTAHAPFFAAPERLADTLATIAREHQ